MPEILTAMCIGIDFGWTTLVRANIVAATEGLGCMMLSASQFLLTPAVVLGVAYAVDLVMKLSGVTTRK